MTLRNDSNPNASFSRNPNPNPNPNPNLHQVSAASIPHISLYYAYTRKLH